MGRVDSSQSTSRSGGGNNATKLWAPFVLLLLTPWMCQAEEYCTNKYVFVASDDSRQEADGSITAGVRVTMKDTRSLDNGEQTVFIVGEHLPSTCGDHFARCNMTLLTESAGSLTTPTSVLLVPLRQGVAQIVYERVNGTLLLVVHNVLRLPTQVDNCQITSLLDLREIPAHTLEEFGIQIAVIGLCLNETSSVNVKVVNMSINFANPSRSVILPLVQDAFHQIASQGVLSNFVLWLDLPRCLSSSFLLSPTYYFRQSRVGVFDATSNSGTEEYFVYYGGTTEKFSCPSPRQLVRISDNVLVIYCENESAEINICAIAGDGVSIREERDSVRYFCSANMDTFISVSDKVTTLNTSSSSAKVNLSLPLASDEDIFIGNCFINSDGGTDSMSVLFAFTSTLGNTFLINFTASLQDPDGAVVLQEQGVNDSTFVHHQVYDELLLYNNGSNAVLLNATSCMNRVDLPNQFSLSLIVPGEGVHRCDCPSRRDVITNVTSGPDYTPVTSTPDHTSSDVTRTDHTTSKTTDHNMPIPGKNQAVTIGSTVAAVIVVVTIVITVVVIRFMWKRKRCRTMLVTAPPFAINPQFDHPMDEINLDLGESGTGNTGGGGAGDGQHGGAGHGGAPAGDARAGDTGDTRAGDNDDAGLAGDNDDAGLAGDNGDARAGDTGGARAGDTGGVRAGDNDDAGLAGDNGDARAGDTGDARAGDTGNACAGDTGDAGGASDTGDARAGDTGDASAGDTGDARAGDTGDASAGDNGDAGGGGGDTGDAGDGECDDTGDAQDDDDTGDARAGDSAFNDNASGDGSGSTTSSRDTSNDGNSRDGSGYVTCEDGEGGERREGGEGGEGSNHERSGRSASIDEQNGKNGEAWLHVPNRKGTLTSYMKRGIRPLGRTSNTAEERGESPNNDVTAVATGSHHEADSGQVFVPNTVAVEEQRDSRNRTH